MNTTIDPGPLVIYLANREGQPQHESQTHRHIAERLTRLLGGQFHGDWPEDPEQAEALLREPRRRYLVPSDTLVGLDHAGALGVLHEDDLFGAVAPHPFLPTKAISHPLPHDNAEAPLGWSDAFGQRIRGAVIEGITVFSVVDGRLAGEQLLRDGPIRLKPVLARGGLGQQVIRDVDQLRLALETLDCGALARCGLVLERQLEDVRTFSVGQVRVGDLCLSYVGEQQLTRDNQGREVYGGSRLQLVRGDYPALLDLPLEPALRQALQQARDFDAAAFACFPGLIASRRNYDVAVGRDPQGRLCTGVLEQSWRIGGASTAELVALERFAADPDLQQLQAESVEFYGEPRLLPPEAELFYRGEDPEAGLLTKYARVIDAGQ